MDLAYFANILFIIYIDNASITLHLRLKTLPWCDFGTNHNYDYEFQTAYRKIKNESHQPILSRQSGSCIAHTAKPLGCWTSWHSQELIPPFKPPAYIFMCKIAMAFPISLVKIFGVSYSSIFLELIVSKQYQQINPCFCIMKINNKKQWISFSITPLSNNPLPFEKRSWNS